MITFTTFELFSVLLLGFIAIDAILSGILFIIRGARAIGTGLLYAGSIAVIGFISFFRYTQGLSYMEWIYFMAAAALLGPLVYIVSMYMCYGRNALYPSDGEAEQEAGDNQTGF